VFLTQVLTMWREQHDHRRERNGLLRILFSEIYLNQTLLDAVGAHYQANMPKEHRMKAGRRTLEREHMYKETWEATSGLASVPWFFREADEPRSSSRPGSKVSFQAAEAYNTRGLNKSNFLRPYIERFMSLSLFTRPSVCP
jgi:hypothetical protein